MCHVSYKNRTILLLSCEHTDDKVSAESTIYKPDNKTESAANATDKLCKTLITQRNDLLTCFQETNENYDTHYEKIKEKLQYLLQHMAIHEQDVNPKIYKTNLYTRKALDTFKAGLLEPYRSFISYKNVESLKDCLLQFRNYNNHKQQVNFLNFIRYKTPIKSAHKSNTQNQNFRTPTSRNNAYFNNTNQYNPNYNQYRNQNINQNYGQNYNQNRNHFPSAPINVQSRPVSTRFPTNAEVFERKPEFKPTPMSISTRNTMRPSHNNNYFRNTGPRNFISEELHNVEDQPENQFLPLEENSSRRSLKCVLLHNGNKYGSIPIGHSTSMKEEYEAISLVLKKIKYEEHQWVICVDLKMVNLFLGQQSGYTKYS
ncbi:hypothetical protein RN001_000151 [Aquatica leii]|uniref:Uncharacterized protein n=1 Tax=Aquatica leii TaxID=1421715 RepID=A0AAN7Q9F2_9COLE|nr:hypothetical protein RN001_000151 [Aquatica leii]